MDAGHERVHLVFIGLPMFFFGLAVMQAQER
jgi:hypothetical protein